LAIPLYLRIKDLLGNIENIGQSISFRLHGLFPFSALEIFRYFNLPLGVPAESDSHPLNFIITAS